VVQSEGWQSRLAYSAPLWVAAILLLDRHLGRFLNTHLYPFSIEVVAIGALLTAVGLAWAIWARVVLGGNWSADVTVKEEHELIRSGPYALSRHPIYTGLVLALFGTALAVGEVRALIALVVAVGSLWYKMRLEETVMRRTFGATYDAYSREVKALIPYVI
jgi:protein-S-isoprenylcysteine O-methyltransferase Ste14